MEYRSNLLFFTHRQGFNSGSGFQIRHLSREPTSRAMDEYQSLCFGENYYSSLNFESVLL